MRSIMQDKKSGRCYICEKWRGDSSEKRYLEEHHIFYGPYRKAAEKHGLKVMLCRYHHQGDIHGTADAIHNNPDKTNDYRLKAEAQRAWERKNTKDPGSEEAHGQFRQIFGKNYL